MDKDLLDQALSTGVRGGQGSRQRRRQATTLINQQENNRNAQEIETAVHYAFHLLVRVRQRKSKKGKLVWNGAEGFDLDDWPSPPPDGNIEAQVEWRGERVQVWRPDWSNKKKNTAFFATLRSTIRGVLPSSINYDEGLVRAKIDTYWNTRQETWYRKSSGQNTKNAATARRRTRIKDQRDMLACWTRPSVLLSFCQNAESTILSKGRSALPSWFRCCTITSTASSSRIQSSREARIWGLRQDINYFPSSSPLVICGRGLTISVGPMKSSRGGPIFSAWRSRYSSWSTKKERAIMEMFPIPAYLRSTWHSLLEFVYVGLDMVRVGKSSIVVSRKVDKVIQDLRGYAVL